MSKDMYFYCLNFINHNICTGISTRTRTFSLSNDPVFRKPSSDNSNSDSAATISLYCLTSCSGNHLNIIFAHMLVPLIDSSNTTSSFIRITMTSLRTRHLHAAQILNDSTKQVEHTLCNFRAGYSMLTCQCLCCTYFTSLCFNFALKVARFHLNGLIHDLFLLTTRVAIISCSSLQPPLTIVSTSTLFEESGGLSKVDATHSTTSALRFFTTPSSDKRVEFFSFWFESMIICSEERRFLCIMSRSMIA